MKHKQKHFKAGFWFLWIMRLIFIASCKGSQGAVVATARNTTPNPSFNDECNWVLLVYATHVTNSFTSHLKDEVIIVKCLAKGHKCQERTQTNTLLISRAWAECAWLLDHNMPQVGHRTSHIQHVYVRKHYRHTRIWYLKLKSWTNFSFHVNRKPTSTPVTNISTTLSENSTSLMEKS